MCILLTAPTTVGLAASPRACEHSIWNADAVALLEGITVYYDNNKYHIINTSHYKTSHYKLCTHDTIIIIHTLTYTPTTHDVINMHPPHVHNIHTHNIIIITNEHNYNNTHTPQIHTHYTHRHILYTCTPHSAHGTLIESNPDIVSGGGGAE